MFTRQSSTIEFEAEIPQAGNIPEPLSEGL
jgi:hypothetical protein